MHLALVAFVLGCLFTLIEALGLGKSAGARALAFVLFGLTATASTVPPFDLTTVMLLVCAAWWLHKGTQA